MEKAEVNFYMYNSDNYLEYAKNYYKQEINQDAIDEIKNLREAFELDQGEKRMLIQNFQKRHSSLRIQFEIISKELNLLKKREKELQSRDELDESKRKYVHSEV